MDGSLYDEDYYTWTKRQAAALRALSERQISNEIDWAPLIDEVEALGRSEVRAVQSALARLMEHLAVAALAPAWHRDQRHWLTEMRAFRGEAAKDCRPSMRQAVTADLDRAWAVARDRAAAKLDVDPGPLPERRPCTLPELLHALPLEALLTRLRGEG